MERAALTLKDIARRGGRSLERHRASPPDLGDFHFHVRVISQEGDFALLAVKITQGPGR
jgi:hypothetical protein